MEAHLPFGSWLKRRRGSLGLTQKALARQVGYAEVTIRKLEANELRPSRQAAAKLAEVLQIAPEERAQFIQFARDEPGREEVALPIQVGPAALPALRTNLPAQSTSFIGRKPELKAVATLISNPDCRLITILGPGGIGKTRLAIEVAQAQVEHYPHGVYFVALAPLTDVEHIAPTIAEAIKFQFQSDGRLPKQQLLDYLRQKQMLLVLDNFEHLLAGVDLVHELLQASPGLKLLMTARERLRLSSETVFTLGNMDYPSRATAKAATDYSAVELFIQTGRRAYPQFQLDTQNEQHVIRICQLVGGMPLAIILAAAWIEVLSPADIVPALAQSFDFLEADFRDLPKRQRNMRALLAYSWQRLSEAERKVFMYLSIFRGGFTLKAAQSVASASVRILAELINKSFVQRIPNDRYEIHALFRQYGEEQLRKLPKEEVAAHDRHSAFYCLLLQQQENHLKSSNYQLALTEIETNIQNIRVAWQWAANHGQVVQLNDALESLSHYYEWRGMVEEGERICRYTAEKLVSATTPITLRLFARLLTWQGVFTRKQGRVTHSEQLWRQSIAILESTQLVDQDVRAEKAFAFLYMGGLNREEAKRFRKQSLALYQAIDDKWEAARALELLAGAYQMMGKHTKADEFLQESFQTWEKMGYNPGVASCLRGLGLSAVNRGEYKKAEQLLQKSLAITRQTCDQIAFVNTLPPLSTVLLNAGKFSECIARLEEYIEIHNFQGRTLRSTVPYSNMSQALTHLAKIEQARTLAESVLADARKLGNSFKIGYALIPLTLVAILEEEYDVSMVMAQECADMWQETGHYMFLGQALALSGFAACELDNFIAAQQFFTQAVEMGKTRLTILPLLYALPGIALLFAKQGKYEQAIELYAAASCHPHVANSLWFATVVGKQITAAASTLAPKVFTAAAACGRTRDLWTTATELLTVLQSGKQLQSGFPLNPATVALPKRNVMSDEVNKDNNDLRASI